MARLFHMLNSLLHQLILSFETPTLPAYVQHKNHGIEAARHRVNTIRVRRELQPKLELQQTKRSSILHMKIYECRTEMVNESNV